MFHPLSPDGFFSVQSLFEELSRHHLFCAGVLNGKYPGQIFVDDPAQPHTALVMKDGMWAYLGGNPDNADFNQALHEGFFNQQITSGGLLISTTDGWRETLQRLFPERPPVAMPRRHYVAHSSAFNGLTPTPDGFTLRFIDEALCGIAGASLPDDVQKVLDLRARASAPDEAAFGYVALHGITYAAHAVIDCIVGDKGDIGLVTDEPFRRRGLAVATSAATIAYGLSHGLSEVSWDCATYNIGSVQTAEKLGLQLTHEHTQYLIVFNEMGHWINLAWNHIDAGQFQAALDVCERLTAQNHEVPAAIHFLAGAGWAGSGDTNRALDCLRTAADHGWDGLADTENCAPLAILRGLPEWEAVIDRIRTNAEQPVR